MSFDMPFVYLSAVNPDATEKSSAREKIGMLILLALQELNAVTYVATKWITDS
jgi:hypothetical protein